MHLTSQSGQTNIVHFLNTNQDIFGGLHNTWKVPEWTIYLLTWIDSTQIYIEAFENVIGKDSQLLRKQNNELEVQRKKTCNCQGSWKAEPCRVYWLLLGDQASTIEMPLVLCRTTYQPTNNHTRTINYMRVSYDPHIQYNPLPELTILGSFLCNSSRAFPKAPDSSSKETWKRKTVEINRYKPVLMPNEYQLHGPFKDKYDFPGEKD